MPVPGEVMVGGRRTPFGRIVLGVVAVALVTAGLLVAGRAAETGEGGAVPGASPTAVANPPGDDRSTEGAAAVAQEFLDAWEDEDWDALQGLLADQSLDAGEAHRLAHRRLAVEATRLEAGEPAADGDRVRVPFEATWTLSGLGDHAFGSEVVVVPAGGGWRVHWWYTTLHPDLTPERRFERVRVYPARAPILGLDSEPLVVTRERVVVAVEPRRAADGPEPILAALADVPGADTGEVAALLERDDLEPDERYPLVEMTREEFAEVRDRLSQVPGLVFWTRPVRVARVPGVVESLVGRVGEVTAELLEELGDPYQAGDTVGRSGLERSHERRLAGEPEREARIMEGDTLISTLAYVEGSDPEPVTVTIDPVAQEAAAGALAGLGHPAALVAVDAATGEVRAAVTHPSDEFNRALGGRYPPGSTFKIVGTTALLAAGLSGGDDVPCPPETRIGGRTFRNAGGYGPGTISFTESFRRSCNTAFALLAGELGADTLDATAATFGFDVDYGVGLGAFRGTYPEPADATELAASAIGQGRVEASPLHMASVAAAARSGVWRSPHVVREGVEVVERPLPDGVGQPLRAMMREVVESGTGTAARLDGEPVAGKTGSAQFGDGTRTHAWFVGFRGDLAFAVVVEGGGAGGAVAGPVAAAFLRALDG